MDIVKQSEINKDGQSGTEWDRVGQRKTQWSKRTLRVLKRVPKVLLIRFVLVCPGLSRSVPVCVTATVSDRVE